MIRAGLGARRASPAGESALEPGEAQYTFLANERGGAVDDAYLYRLAREDFLLVVNAANRAKEWEWLRRCPPQQGVSLDNVSEEVAMISLQGPHAAEIMCATVPANELPEAKRNRLSMSRFDSAELTVARTGYTGESVCFELFCPRASAVALWEKLAALGAVPCGLGARDSLRLEAGLPLYGHELGTDPEGNEIPIFANDLARFAVRAPGTGDYVGRTALEAQREERIAIRRSTVTAPPARIASEGLSERATRLAEAARENTRWRRTECVNLIPSEQPTSAFVDALCTADPAGRYNEHNQLKWLGPNAPDVRYYKGTSFIMEQEEELKAALRTFFNYVQVEPRVISGQMANDTVYDALKQFRNRHRSGTEPQALGPVFVHDLNKGGHLSAQVPGALKNYVRIDARTGRPAVLHFPMSRDNPHLIDVEETKRIIAQKKPELLVFGRSVIIQREPVREIAAFIHAEFGADNPERPVWKRRVVDFRNRFREMRYCFSV